MDDHLKHQIIRAYYRIEIEAAKIESARSYKERMLALRRTLLCMNAVAGFDISETVMPNFHATRHRLQVMQLVLPVVQYVEDAYAFSEAGDMASEKRALLLALNEIRGKQIKDSDFIEAAVMPEGTGEIISEASILSHLERLGWTYMFDSEGLTLYGE